jgi:YD repeat-containing protein
VLLMQFMQLAQAKKVAEAEELLKRALADRTLDNAANRYNLACAQAVQGKTEAALETLATAIERGWADADHMRKDADLESLRKLPRFEELAKAAAEKKAQAPQPTPPVHAEVKDGVALVSEANTNWVPQIQQFLVLDTFPPPAEGASITKLGGPVGDLLRQWQKEGTAAGLHGFLYDNHDRDHSNMDYGQFPQLTRIEYAEAPKQRNVDHGLQHLFLHNAPTIGNSSTALTAGPYWSSQTRHALRQGRLANILAQQYLNNHLYFYPEHRDHDADGHGDVFHANVPYVITSQGSSGSDRPFLHAVACTLAAFRPDTQRALIAKKLLMPTVQMIFRLSRKPVATPEDYLTGKAHPAVFGEETLDVEKMVRLAHELKADEIPPVVLMRVVEEDAARAGVDYFEAGDNEKVFDTVCAISRVHRAARWQRRMVVSVEGTRDFNNRPLAFHWRLLRGDPDRVQIKPLDAQGTRAELLVAWHERRPIEPGSALLSSRVDIGVFAHNGAHYSAPSFISWYFPANEKRVYDDAHRIVSIERFSAADKEHYTDPALVTPAVWTDAYHYDAQGQLLGWTRTRKDATEEFTRDGALVLKKDDQGRPAEARTVRYVREQAKPDQWPELRQQPGAELLSYTYKSETDRLGEISGRKPAEK